MEAVYDTDELQKYLDVDKSHLEPDSIHTNEALKLLHDKNLLGTLNKAISDISLSWYKYIYKKKKTSDNEKESSDLKIAESIDIFSNDLVGVLTSIISKSKTVFIQDKLGIDLGANGIEGGDIFSKSDMSVESPKQVLNSQSYSTTIVSPYSRNKDSNRTSVERKTNVKNSVRKNLFSGYNTLTKISPPKHGKSAEKLAKMTWIHKSLDKNSQKKNPIFKMYQSNPKRSRNKQIGKSLTSTHSVAHLMQR